MKMRLYLVMMVKLRLYLVMMACLVTKRNLHLMSLVVREPQLLEWHIDKLRFEDGMISELEDGRELRTENKSIHEKYGFGSNTVIVDWELAADGLFWQKGRGRVFEAVNGGLLASYSMSGYFEVEDVGRCWMLIDEQSKSGKTQGNFFMCDDGFVPDGEYKIGWFKKVQVRDGRVV